MSLRRKTCKQCRGKLAPGEYIHAGCVDAYAESMAKKAERAAAKRVKAIAKEGRANDAKLRESMKSKQQLLKEAQAAFNEYIRWRDRGLPCISCGKPPNTGFHKGMDAGHYRSVGSAPQVRFHEANVHAQCVSCNRDKAGNAVEYRINLIKRIGITLVEEVESIDKVQKLSHDDIRAIRDRYRKINSINRKVGNV